jgi:hypothetical protein
MTDIQFAPAAVQPIASAGRTAPNVFLKPMSEIGGKVGADGKPVALAFTQDLPKDTEDRAKVLTAVRRKIQSAANTLGYTGRVHIDAGETSARVTFWTIPKVVKTPKS